MALEGTSLVVGIVFSISVILIFCYCFDSAGKELKAPMREQEKEWERIERASAFQRVEEQRDAPRVSHHTKRPIPGVAHSIQKFSRDLAKQARETKTVRVLRGGEFIGNRMRFKVKILNESPYIISDVTVFLISYPKKSLRLDANNNDVVFPKIEPHGFRSPSFDFLPTQDCVRGEIVAGVSYIDERGEPHVLNTKPFVIRSVCDLLLPDQIDPEEFTLKLKDLHCGELVVSIASWTPEEMYEKSLRIIEDANFYEVDSNLDTKEGTVYGEIHGLARGKYTGKSVAVEILITGPSNKKGASCTLKVSGEDEAMILPAIDDLRERLNAWLCPLCGSPLTIENVKDLREGKAVVCPFCNVPIGR